MWENAPTAKNRAYMRICASMRMGEKWRMAIPYHDRLSADLPYAATNSETHLHSLGPRQPCSSLFATVTVPLNKSISASSDSFHSTILFVLKVMTKWMSVHCRLDFVIQETKNKEKCFHLRTQHISDGEYLMSVLFGKCFVSKIGPERKRWDIHHTKW